MQAIDANPEDKTKCTLIFSNVTEEDILLRKEFEALAAKKPDQFKVILHRRIQCFRAYFADRLSSLWTSLLQVGKDLRASSVLP